MNDFENRLTAVKQKKFMDIIPPSKGRIDFKRRDLLSRLQDDPKNSFMPSQREKVRKKEVPGAPTFVKKIGKQKHSIPFRTLLFKIATYRMKGFAALKKLFFGARNTKKSKQKLFDGRNVISLKRIAGSLIGLLLVGGGVWGYTELPRVKVVLFPIVLEHEVKVSFEGRTNAAQIDYGKGIVPLEFLSFTLREDREFPSTGLEERILKARGIITVFNAYSSQSQPLVERTRFISEDGHLFRTTKKITVPGAKVEGGTITPSSYDVEVEAAEAGSEYNIGSSTFSIPGFAGTPRYLGFYGKSRSAMSGGFVGEVEVIASEDLNGARKELEGILSGKVQGEFLLKLPAGFEVVDSIVKNIETINFSVKAGESGKSFKADAVMGVKAFIIRSRDLADFIDESIAASLPYLMEEVRRMRKIQKTIGEADIGKGSAKGTIDISTKIVHQLNQEEFRNLLKGKDGEGVRTALYDDPRIKKALVSFWPMWAKRVPVNPGKIRIEVAPPEE